jgi:predicted transposase YdaD
MLVAMSAVIHQPYDKLFKLALSDRRAAIEFFKTYLPISILIKIDLSTLELVNAAFINELFKNSDADIIYKVKFKEGNLFLYLQCEHQSTVDDLIAIRLRNFQTCLYPWFIKWFIIQAKIPGMRL